MSHPLFTLQKKEHFEQELMNTWDALGLVLAQHPEFDRSRLSIN